MFRPPVCASELCLAFALFPLSPALKAHFASTRPRIDATDNQTLVLEASPYAHSAQAVMAEASKHNAMVAEARRSRVIA